jgi:hypothetical protein
MSNALSVNLVGLVLGLASGLIAGLLVHWRHRAGFRHAGVRAGIVTGLGLTCAVVLLADGTLPSTDARGLAIPSIALSTLVSGVYASKVHSHFKPRPRRRERSRDQGRPYQYHNLFTPFPTDYLRPRPQTEPVVDLLPLLQRLDNIIVFRHPSREGRDSHAQND